MERQPVVIGALTLAAFDGAFGLWRFMDDWSYAAAASRALSRGEVAAFVLDPFSQHWSPLWHAFEALNIWLLGWESDLLIRSLTVALVVAGLALFLRTARRLGIGNSAALCGAVVLALHPLNAAPYYSFDAYSQVTVDLLSWYAASALVTTVVGGAMPGRLDRPSVLVCLFIVGLLVKEQALATLAAVVFLTCWFHAVEPASGVHRQMLRRLCAACATVAAAFTMLRLASGLSPSNLGDLRLCASCVPSNLATFVSGAILPIRAMSVYFAVLEALAHPVLLLTAGASLVAVAAALFWGIRERVRSGGLEGRRVAMFAGLMFASAFPTALLSHVSELYAHTGLFWFAMLVALSVEGWLSRIGNGSALRRIGAALAMVVYAATLLGGLRANLAEMRESGNRARRLQDRFRYAVSGLDDDTAVAVRGLEDGRAAGDYGSYRVTVPGVLLLDPVDSLALAVGGRLTIVDADAWPKTGRTATFYGETVVVSGR